MCVCVWAIEADGVVSYFYFFFFKCVGSEEGGLSCNQCALEVYR